MFRQTRLVHFTPGSTPADRAATAAALRSMPEQLLVGPTLPGVFNGGDLLAHFRFDHEAHFRATEPAMSAVLGRPHIAHIDSVLYPAGSADMKAPRLEGGVYRALFLSFDGDQPGLVERFETEMRAMPRYVAAIANCRLSRVVHANGARRWTHVWEQEFTSLADLAGPYMTHPYHWGWVDRWFDGECPQQRVDPLLCHSFCALERSILA
ncbi:MAG TPA: Dabb family protein [Ramlibacter sp.]|nr:Dabb family protein [Ramlibacter sp.]